jgi:hypothetical protein
MDFQDFTTIDFDPRNFESRSGPGWVYILCWVGGDGEPVPFYVGETHSVCHRMNHYECADFQAPTDFNVGETVKHLRAGKRSIVTKIKPSTNRTQDQDTWIADLKAKGYTLLNGQTLGYDYNKTTEAEQRLRVQGFVDNKLLAARQTAQPISN